MGDLIQLPLRDLGLSQEQIDGLCRVDPWCWVYFNQLVLFGGPYQHVGHEFQVPIWRCMAQRQCAKKSPQMAGFTEMAVCRGLHGLIHGRYKQGALFLFPTSDEVSDFSKSRFKTFIRNNAQAVGKYVRDTDSSEVKRVGDGMLFFRGARMTKDVEGAQKTSSKLKSLPVDLLVGDEIDEMDEGALGIAQGRLDHSSVQEELYLANATVPNYGIDRMYQNSDQRVWMIECPKCGRENCLELQFPDCLKRTGGGLSGAGSVISTQAAGLVYRGCKKCGGKLNPSAGYWVARYPEKSDDMVGWWISHLNSFYTRPETILKEWEDPATDMVRFHNRRLAMAYIASDNKLEHNDIYLCCGQDVMANTSVEPCAMGVDVGAKLHVLIGIKVANIGIKVLKAIRLNTFEDVWDLGRQFNVSSVVFDMHPELHKVREFCAVAPYSAFGCVYSEQQVGVAAWNENSKVVTVNRTELCDTTHRIVTTAGRLELPRRDSEIKQIAIECCNTAKVYKEDPKTGIKKAFYVKLGPDHYRHSLNYLALAVSRVQSVDKSGSVVTKPVDFFYG